MDYLECQQCGIELRELTPEEYQDMTYNPYNYVAYCRDCRRSKA